MALPADLRDLTIAGARDALAAGDVSARELTEAHLAAMEGARDLNAFITETPDRALAAADESDARRADGTSLGPLDGIPLAIKDLFCTDGVQTTAASHILEGFVPPYESTVDDQPARRRHDHAGQDQSRRIRHGLIKRDQLFRQCRKPLAPRRRQPARWCPAARPAAPPRRSRAGSASARPGRIPAARSASRRRSAASSG